MIRPAFKSTVYHGESCLGEADVYPAAGNPLFQFPNNEIRISYFTAPSERCPPLSILQTVSPFSVRCKVKARLVLSDQFPIHRLHTSCFQEQKTAVVVLGGEEIHMVAMRSKAEKSPCFWCFAAPVTVYHSCLIMLNLRCLSIVFDLDETLIVANSMKSFEDKIASLSHRIDAENDPVRVSVMSAELKRYLEDRELLKQYTDTDSVMDNGRLINVQNEEFPPLTLSGNHGAVVSSRPVIRLLEGNNVVLTRINPDIRDTSVLVRLRPAWEDLRSYLTAKGRKRFEVFVCTMAERDYALEMWRLLDPEAHLISARQLQERIVCVKSGSRKSLLNVFQTGSSIPKMSMVIDDRVEVWDDRDQPRVHVVPAFAPYYAPQAETANAVPVLCVARNVACNVRGGFFREFDENLLRRVVQVAHEDEILDLPVPPDASDYLMVVGEETGGMAANRDNNAAAGAPGLEGTMMGGAADADRRPSNQPLPPVMSQGNQRGGAPLPQAPPQQNKPPFQPDGSLMASSLSIGVLLEIGRKCDSKVEFRPVASGNKDFQFSIEAVFNSEKIGVGVGRTKKEAQFQAADNALCFLANQYVDFISPEVRDADKDLDSSVQAENGFLGPSPAMRLTDNKP